MSRVSGQKRSPQASDDKLLPDSKRPRNQDGILKLNGFVNGEHAAAVRQYLTQISVLTRERERGVCQVEAIPNGLLLVQMAIANLVGELWECAVELSKVRIDAAIHELFGDLVQEDLSPIGRLEAIKSLDREQRARLREPEKEGAGGVSSEGSHLLAAKLPRAGGRSAIGGGRKRGGRKHDFPDGLAEPPDLEPTSIAREPDAAATLPAPASNLFDDEPDGRYTENAADQAREESLVLRKQAELSREVTLDDVHSALAMFHAEPNETALVPVPNRLRKHFGMLSAMFYSSYIERIAVMRAVAPSPPPNYVKPPPQQQQFPGNPYNSVSPKRL